MVDFDIDDDSRLVIGRNKGDPCELRLVYLQTMRFD